MNKIIFICTLALVFCACSTNDEPESPEKPVTTVCGVLKNIDGSEGLRL